MCDRCVKAGEELDNFLDQLEEKYPATEVDGKPVPRSHHVNVAIIGAAQKAFVDEVTEMAKLRGEANPLEQGPFGGGFKIVENV